MDGVKVSGRLRELRTEYDNGKPISHAKLAEKLQEKYHVKISEQTLKDYERAAINGTTQNTTKGNAICGMRIEYLDMFADFYGVSTDYILGKSDIKTPDVNAQAAIDYTGLSEGAVYNLHDLKASSTAPIRNSEIMRTINLLLDEQYFSDVFWHRIFAFLFTTGADFPLRVPAGEFLIKRDEALRALLEQNNDFLVQLKKKIVDENGGGNNGKY